MYLDTRTKQILIDSAVLYHEEFLVTRLRNKWQQILPPSNPANPQITTPASTSPSDLLLKALSFFLCYFRTPPIPTQETHHQPSESQYTLVNHSHSHSHSHRLVFDLITRNQESALSIILQSSSSSSSSFPLDKSVTRQGTTHAELSIPDYIFIAQYSSDSNNKALAMSRIARLMKSMKLQRERENMRWLG